MDDLAIKTHGSEFLYLLGFNSISHIFHIFLDVSFIPALFFSPSTVPEEVPFLSFIFIAAVQLAFSMIILILILLRQALSWFGVWKGEAIEEWGFFWSAMVFLVATLLLILLSIALIDLAPRGFNFRFHMILFGVSGSVTCSAFMFIMVLKYQGDVNHNTRLHRGKKQKAEERHANL